MIEKIYRAAIIPLFETWIKGRKTFEYLQSLESSQWHSFEDIRARQLAALRKIVRYCEEHSRYYRNKWRERGVTVDDLTCLEDFQRWPLMTRAEMRDHASEIASDETSLGYVCKATGGSSGEPLSFRIEKSADERRVAATHRGYGWAGAAPGTQQLYLWGNSLGQQSRLRAVKERIHSQWLYRRHWFSCFQLDADAPLRFLNALRRVKPRYVVAYTTPAYEMARAILEMKQTVPTPEAVIVGAEKLHAFQRETIEEAFGAPVFETYGSREFTLIAAECEQHSGLHVTAENLLVEIVDDAGQTVPSGVEGNVVVTDFYNRAMPFVRYPIGDRAIAKSETCVCGRGLPLIEKIVGRQLDTLTMRDGRKVAGEYFPHLLKDYPAIRQFQVRQMQDEQLHLHLVVDSRWDRQTRSQLESELTSSLGSDNPIAIREVESIPLTGAGKRQVVLRSEERI